MFNDLVSHLHWLAILAGASSYFVLGAIWYSNALFAKTWVKLLNIKMDDPDAKKGMVAMMAVSFVLMFVASTGIGIIQQVLPAIDTMHAAKLGLLISIFFSVTSFSINYLYTRKPLMLYFIDGGYHVVGIVLSSIVIKLLS